MSLYPAKHIYTFSRLNRLWKLNKPIICTACKRQASTVVAPTDDPSKAVVETGTGKPIVNVPFAKNLFLGKFDTKVLVFPEIATNEELGELNELVAPVERYFTESLDSKSIDANAKIPDETLQQIKDLGLFGQQIPVEYGGLGLNATKYARLAEVTSLDASIGVTLAAHQAIGLKGILIAGTEEQKAKYLPKLATGEYVAAFCLTEPSSGSDAASIQTKAVVSEDGKTFHLTGNKIWISNGGIADIFTVFARTEYTNTLGQKEEKITAFIVERAFGGVTHGKPEDKLGIRGSNTCEVNFDNTPVPIENVIGEVGGGFKIAMNILNSGRFSMGSSVAGVLKHVMTSAVEHAISRKQFGQALMEYGLIQEKFAKIAIRTYAMESMAYLTAGIIDGYQQPDASVEAAMVKVFSSEGAWECSSECLQIFGGLGYMKDYPYERYVRDSRISLIFEGTNEVLRLFIALQCLQHSGRELSELVKKMKNPLNNVGSLVKIWLARHNARRKKPSLSMKLYDHVHPNVCGPAEELETRVFRLQSMTELYLAEYRNQIVNEQMSLKRFADIAIDMYAVTACLARCSRSLSIGLRNADHEMLLCSQFCFEAFKRIDDNLQALEATKALNGDENYKQIAETIFKHGGYAAEHPLTRNW